MVIILKRSNCDLAVCYFDIEGAFAFTGNINLNCKMSINLRCVSLCIGFLNLCNNFFVLHNALHNNLELNHIH